MDWQPISIDGRTESFLVAIVNESNDNFLFNLTNLKELWCEKLTWDDMLQRAKSENPIINVDAIERTIFSPAKHYQCSTNESELLLKTKYYIGGGVPFYFQWKLTKCNADEFYEQITRKLLVSLLNVQDQHIELVDIIKRKDAEIAQYKIEGASLARKQVATQPFVKSEFDGKFELMSKSSLFADNSDTIKMMCNYSDLIKDSSTVTLDVPGKPSPSKIFKPQKKKEQNAMRKFQSKRDCKIQYESSFELPVSDEETERQHATKSEADDIQIDQHEEAPKRKLRSKLNL